MTAEERKKRTFLVRTVCRYLDAAIANDPNGLPISPNLRATYNGKEVALGATEIWDEAICFPARQTFVDAVTMNAMFYGTATNEADVDDGAYPYPKKNSKYKDYKEFIRSPNQWWHYLLRLHCTEDGLIDEIEEITIPNTLIHFEKQPREYPMRNLMFDSPVSAEDRLSREEMIAITETYFDGISKYIKPEEILVHPDCQRIELGQKCTNNKKGFQSVSARFADPNFYWIVKNRRYPVVDTALGVCISLVEFAQARPDTNPGWTCSEAFKIVDGTFREILVTYKPMCLDSGWKGVDRVK